MPNIHLPGSLPGMNLPDAPAVIALNDLQLIVLVAAQLATPGEDPGPAVETACELVAASILAVRGGALARAMANREQGLRASVTGA